LDPVLLLLAVEDFYCFLSVVAQVVLEGHFKAIPVEVLLIQEVL